jgi:hypothetical protein
MESSLIQNNFKRNNHATFFNGGSSAVDTPSVDLSQLEEENSAAGINDLGVRQDAAGQFQQDLLLAYVFHLIAAAMLLLCLGWIVFRMMLS